jgi:hypothetical protein
VSVWLKYRQSPSLLEVIDTLPNILLIVRKFVSVSILSGVLDVLANFVLSLEVATARLSVAVLVRTIFNCLRP